MGSLFGGGGSSGGQGLFGGQQQTSQSSSTNQAFPFLKGALTSNIGNIGAAGNQLASMLGLNGAPAQNAGFSNFNNSTGYQFGLNQGIQSIVGNAATNGLLNSGGTLKAIDTYGQNYANTQYGNYMNQLMGLLGAGNQSASVLGNAGNTFQSTSQGTGNTGGAGGFLGSLLGKGSGGGGAGAGIGSLLGKGSSAAGSLGSMASDMMLGFI